MSIDLNHIHNIDCSEGLQKLADKSIDICVTSPPYNLGIDYGTYEDKKPRNDYLDWLDQIFKQLHRVLKDDGHFWLNVGYSNVDPWVGMDVANVARKHFVLQNNINWVKSISIDNVTTGHFKPINSERFANPTWEHLFHFTKTGSVKCDKLSIGVPYMWDCNLDNSGRIKGRLAKKYGFKNILDFNKNADDLVKQKFDKELNEKLINQKPKPNKRCRGNTWFMPYETISNRDKGRGKHPATYPIQLVENCIQFSNLQDGILLDPFMGTGTSAIGALRQNLDFVGFDIDSDYIDFANQRIMEERKMQLFKD